MLELKNVYKTYRSKNGVTHRALNNVTLTFDETGLVFIVGKSGGGKSTLLNMIGALDKPDRGEMLLYKNSFSKFTASDYDSYRNTHIGVIFQEYNLIKTLTVYENIALSLGLRKEKTDGRVDEVIKKLGLTDIAHRKPNQISGGQSQRVAIARAIVKDPRIILADEPTGNLDTKTGKEMFSVFKELSKDHLVVIVTHDRDIADEIGDRVIEIKDGKVYKDIVRTDTLYERSVDLVGDKLIRVPKGKSIDDEALETVNDLLKATDKDTFIINESDVTKVKSMNLHVKNAVEILPEENTSYYFPYRPNEVEKKEIELKRATMPMKTGVKLSLSMLKHKTFRLIVTVLMLIISLTISSFMTAMEYYDVDRATAKTMSSGVADILLVTKNTEHFSRSNFTEGELTAIKDGGVNILANVYGMSIPLSFAGESAEYTELSKEYHPLTRLIGFAECSDVSLMGVESVAGTLIPKDMQGAVISSVIADYMIHFKVIEGVKEYNDVLGKEINVSGQTFRIDGIYKGTAADIPKFADIFEENHISFDESLDSGVSFVPSASEITEYLEGFKSLDGYLYVLPGATASMLRAQNRIDGELALIEDMINNLSLTKLGKKEDAGSLVIERETSSFGIYIDFNTACMLSGTDRYAEDAMSAIEDFVDKFNKRTHPATLSGKSNAGHYYVSLTVDDYDIAGVISEEDSLYTANTLFIDTDAFNKVADSNLVNNALLVSSPTKIKTALGFISEARNCDAEISVSYVKDYSTTKSIFDAIAGFLKVILIVTSLLSALLLFSFISSTIKIESRQIGILRGMGARGFDTFKAFAIEGVLISVFSVLITAGATAILFPMLNSLISTFGGKFYVHNYLVMSPYVALGLVLTAALITLASIIFPMIKLIRLTPVNAINANEVQR